MQFPLLGHSPSSPYVTPRGDIVKPSLPPLRKQKLNAIKNYIPPLFSQDDGSQSHLEHKNGSHNLAIVRELSV